ncbi:MAG: glutamate synthase large subunit [Bradymonadia bacterium]
MKPVRQGLYDPAYERDACGVGFVVNIDGTRTHEIIEQGTRILKNLTHRGAVGSDPATGDGAGLSIQMPDAVLRRECHLLGIRLPPPGRYAVGMVFLSPDPDVRAFQKKMIARTVAESSLRLLGWRPVKVNPAVLGPVARKRAPVIQQVFLEASTQLDPRRFERQLFLLRRIAENRVQAAGEKAKHFHVASLSSRTIIYKGLMLPAQIPVFYQDLSDPEAESAFVLVHQRYSTNTFPTWDLAQPFRYLAHNGEINTLRANVNWMRAREGTLHSEIFGDDIRKMFPILTEDGSDSCQLDNALELLVASGRSLAHAMCMLIPEAFEGDEEMEAARRDFYAYHSLFQEPWDGPAAVMFTDGVQIGATLDRNGLRPARYVQTTDGQLIAASEAGVVEVPPHKVVHKGRLTPGRMLLVDTAQGRIISDEEIKAQLAQQRPYGQWLTEHRVHLDELPQARFVRTPNPAFRVQRHQVFGFTDEDLKRVIAPMISTGKEAIGSMGNDAALACLSTRPRLLYHYFKQQFAQVTNPPIDSIREKLVMSLGASLGAQGNLLDERPEHGQMLAIDHPLLTAEQIERLRQNELPWLSVSTLRCLFKAGDGGPGLKAALDDLCAQAEIEVKAGASVLILSDRRIDAQMAPIPALLATSAVNHHLIRAGLRTQCSLVVEAGDAREVAHFALLIGYGATCVHPYVAYETIDALIAEGTRVPEGLDGEQAIAHYLKAVGNGLLKIFAKMGISTLKSYRGAQIFEAVGLDRDLVDEHFTHTASRISGVGLDVLAREVEIRHRRGFPEEGEPVEALDPGGLYQWRRRGEVHAFGPKTIAKLQHAVRADDFELYREYAAAADDHARRLCTLRGLFRIKEARAPVPIDVVEPAAEIVKRFCTGAMSFGSISKEAHETLAIAMNRIGGRSNSGEGGEDAVRFQPDENGDLRRSAIKQVASGRFGVTSWYLVNGDVLQIKIAQGAKPGEGGQLPGHKVDSTIARIRHSTEGVGLISPPPHHDIYSIEDLAQLIYDLKNANRFAEISVKLVSESGVGTIAAGVAKGKADRLLISGHDGGTGASPLTSIKNAGVPWEIGLAEVQQTLVLNDLRGRIRVQVDGGLRTGRDVIVGALLGAEEFGFSTAPLASMGCILMRVCHLNTCPVGIATQDPELRKRFKGTPEHVVRFFFFIAEEVRHYMARMGFRSFNEMVGRVDMLYADPALDHWKARHLDFSDILYAPDVPYPTRRREHQDHGLDRALDLMLIEDLAPALNEGKRVQLTHRIRNVHRTVGTLIGAEISRRYGPDGLPDDTVHIDFEGTTGQSFGAFVPRGMTLVVRGDANDYTGKGLSGGRIVIRTPEGAPYVASENVIVGNVALYGATSGMAFFEGLAGERFAVRNSGATAVVEGIGDHGCEYMTGGRVVVLGPTGRNFAAGMSGGVAHLYDPHGLSARRCNLEMVELEPLSEGDAHIVKSLVSEHHTLTGSPLAQSILDTWATAREHFVTVMPVDYKRALAARVRSTSPKHSEQKKAGQAPRAGRRKKGAEKASGKEISA